MKRFVLTVVFVLLAAVPAAAQQSAPSFLDMPGAEFRFHFNEVSLDGKPAVDDPVKFRMSAEFIPNREQYLGAFSGDLRKGSRIEKVMITLKKDFDESGFIENFCQGPFGVEDATMRRCGLATYWNRSVLYGPIVAPDGRVLLNPESGPNGTNPATNMIQTGSGRFVAVIQDDGNFVVYDRQTGAAIWSSYTGLIQYPQTATRSSFFGKLSHALATPFRLLRN